MRVPVKAVAAVLMTVALAALALRGVTAQPVGDPEKEPPAAGELLPLALEQLYRRLDANHDNRLSADELPSRLGLAFGRIDLDKNGFVSWTELEHAVTADAERTARRGVVVAERLITVVDDFLVDAYHNGERIPDSRRTLLEDAHGATVEKIDVEVRRGDWLVFHVVNNRFRWGGARYFAVTGIKEGRGRAFTTELTTGSWKYCDDPLQSAAFIADPKFLWYQGVYVVEKPWEDGDALMKKYAGEWAGNVVWGGSSDTWIRYDCR